MNLVIYDSLLPHILGITPHIAWLLAAVPPMIEDEEDRRQVTRVLEELALKQAHLQGILLDLEANLIPISEEGSVTTICPNTIDGLTIAEQLLRENLAEVIVTRGEMELAAEAKIVSDCEAALAEDDALYAAKATVSEKGKPYGCGSGKYVCFNCSCLCCHREEIFTGPCDDVPEIDFDGFPIDFPRT